MFEAVASIAGGLIGADAASDAAGAQVAASKAAVKEQRRQFDLTRKDMEPFRETGTLANIKLRELLGLAPAPQSLESIKAELRASGRFNIPGQTLERVPDMVFGEGGPPSDFMPFRLVGTNTIDEAALEREAQRIFEQQSNVGSGEGFGELLQSFTGEDLENDPGFQFRLSEGQKAIENAARARGLSLSPMTVKELLRYSQDFASNEFGNAFNRDIANRTTKFNFLTGTSGGGQQAAQTVGNFGANMASNVGNLITGAGNARGAASIAGANAITGGINSALNFYNQKNMLDRILNRGGISGTSSTPFAGSYGWGNV